MSSTDKNPKVLTAEEFLEKRKKSDAAQEADIKKNSNENKNPISANSNEVSSAEATVCIVGDDNFDLIPDVLPDLPKRKSDIVKLLVEYRPRLRSLFEFNEYEERDASSLSKCTKDVLEMEYSRLQALHETKFVKVTPLARADEENEDAVDEPTENTGPAKPTPRSPDTNIVHTEEEKDNSLKSVLEKKRKEKSDDNRTVSKKKRKPALEKKKKAARNGSSSRNPPIEEEKKNKPKRKPFRG